jgi:hypothetical protein
MVIDHEGGDFSLWSIEDRAWAAGFIDGDGMISFYLRSDRKNDFYVKVGAANTELAPLEKLQLMFGGSICTVHKATASKNWSPSWAWTVTHRRAERVLRAIAPFLVCKHRQASSAIESRALISGDKSRRSPEVIAQLRATELRFRELNRKGLKHELPN